MTMIGLCPTWLQSLRLGLDTFDSSKRVQRNLLLRRIRFSVSSSLMLSVLRAGGLLASRTEQCHPWGQRRHPNRPTAFVVGNRSRGVYRRLGLIRVGYGELLLHVVVNSLPSRFGKGPGLSREALDRRRQTLLIGCGSSF